MKILTLVIGVFVGASGFLIKVPIAPKTPVIANIDWVHRQKLILPFFDNVCDVSTNLMIIRWAEEFDINTLTPDSIEDADVIAKFKTFFAGKSFLAKGEIFSEYNKDHLSELKVISEVLCGAKNFDTFLIAAAWARQQLNCGLFIDAFYSALIKRRDTSQLSIPAPYELIPNYFIQKDVIITGSSLLTGIPITPSSSVREDGNAYFIDANYTSDVTDSDDERKLAYFNEDVGLNSYYFLRKLSKLPWFNDVQNPDSTYGEYLYFIMKQMATRYDLERYANGFEGVASINWNAIDSSVYDPMLIYSNGKDFCPAVNFVDPVKSEEVTMLSTIEDNISAVVSHMRQSGYEKTVILNNLMEILVTGNNNYETLAHQILRGSCIDAPSVLEHYMTTARDPIFWKLNKKIVQIIETALEVLPTYSKNELYFPGVEIMNVDIKKMNTYFESYDFDVTASLRAPDIENSFQVKISQSRLNHKPFSVKVNISSLVTQKGLLKIYLGPKILPGELAIKKSKFMLLDSFEINLKKGTNVVTRSSEEITNLSPDFLSLKNLYKNVEDAELGLQTLTKENIRNLISFPSRLIIPKGLESGLPLQVFVFVAPFVKVTTNGLGVTSTEFNSAIMSPGYPLDLRIENWQLFDLPNAMVKEIMVTHKDISKGGSYKGGNGESPKSWGGDNTYDYSSKKGQYGKQSDYGSKKGQYMKPTEYSYGSENTLTVSQPDYSETRYEKLSLLKTSPTTTTEYVLGHLIQKTTDYSNKYTQNDEHADLKVNEKDNASTEINLDNDKVNEKYNDSEEKYTNVVNNIPILKRPLLKSTKKFYKNQATVKPYLKTDLNAQIIKSVGKNNQWEYVDPMYSTGTFDGSFKTEITKKSGTKDTVDSFMYGKDITVDKQIDKTINKSKFDDQLNKTYEFNISHPEYNTITRFDDANKSFMNIKTDTKEINKSDYSKNIAINTNNEEKWNKSVKTTDLEDTIDPVHINTYTSNVAFGGKMSKSINKQGPSSTLNYATDVDIKNNNGEWAKTITKTDLAGDKDAETYASDVFDGKWSKTINKPGPYSTSNYETDVNINNDNGQWAKTITKTDLAGDKDAETYASDVFDGKWSKTINKPGPYSTSNYETDVNINNDNGQWAKTITKTDLTEDKNAVTYGSNIAFDGKWSKTINKPGPYSTSNYETDVDINNDNGQWAKTITKTDLSGEIGASEENNVPYEKIVIQRPNFYDYVLHGLNYGDYYEEPTYE